jgi:hypothetical protein
LYLPVLGSPCLPRLIPVPTVMMTIIRICGVCICSLFRRHNLRRGMRSCVAPPTEPPQVSNSVVPNLPGLDVVGFTSPPSFCSVQWSFPSALRVFTTSLGPVPCQPPLSLPCRLCQADQATIVGDREIITTRPRAKAKVQHSRASQSRTCSAPSSARKTRAGSLL